MRNILIIVTLGVCLTSCSVYKDFPKPNTDVEGLYRDTTDVGDTLVADTSNFLGVLDWRDIFTDPRLQSLIEQGLKQNADVNIALSRIEQAEASLSAARLAYLPSLGFSSISGTVSNFNNTTSKTYGFPLSASWQVPVFGGLRNARLSAKATLEQVEASKRAVQSQLIASIASTYYLLVKTDKQLEITEHTIELWGQTLATMRSMKEIGLTNEAGIAQSEANYRSILLSRLSLQQLDRELENTLCVMLAQVPQHIERSNMDALSLPEEYSVGIPLQMTANRPDVEMAEKALATAYYATNIARSAFYPNIMVNGSLSWTNSAGAFIVNPGKLLSTVAGSVTAPIFAKGVNRANLNIAKEAQKQALIDFEQTLINAGAEVSNALFLYKTAKEKEIQRSEQIKALEFSEKYTRELFRLSSSTYLEVLTAQQNLLSAQISETEDVYEKNTSIIQLYQALGGGSE